ncbi:DODA-type extradiol aromatic ring-opening family dioxygenase [Marinobacterium litorale]|uniref:DODA-type extradiol aromatic ring-opening family dioxygenase n=1 Tax=Marinobacterium litorale TaxID=404770 RepID=UPI00040251B9|nr:class III extradiol ring-cleavage dioxygenase [Marinobacterium litorale]
MNTTFDILYLSHGGGPRPLLGDPDHAEMVAQFKALARELPKPSAILLISAHWEESVPTITAGANPGLIYDYYGFPPESYEIQYPAPGEPELAHQLAQCLKDAGMPAHLDHQRGFDHGMFVPLKVMYPDADIPVVQLSLINDLSAANHLALGQALQALKYENLLVIGSGFSFHNMRAFYAPETGEIRASNLAFEQWLQETLTTSEVGEEERARRLESWERAPAARFCHPREEHLLPLHVCYGLAGRPCDDHLSARILGKQSGTFVWHGSKVNA